MTRLHQGSARTGERLAEHLVRLEVVLPIHLSRGDFQLHDHPGHALQQRIMQFPRHALAFGEPGQRFNLPGRVSQFAMSCL